MGGPLAEVEAEKGVHVQSVLDYHTPHLHPPSQGLRKGY